MGYELGEQHRHEALSGVGGSGAWATCFFWSPAPRRVWSSANQPNSGDFTQSNPRFSRQRSRVRVPYGLPRYRRRSLDQSNGLFSLPSPVRIVRTLKTSVGRKAPSQILTRSGFTWLIASFDATYRLTSETTPVYIREYEHYKYQRGSEAITGELARRSHLG